MSQVARILPPPRQQGIALVVVLLLLLVVTLVGLAAMRGTLLQERMAGNAAARGVAFQRAEAVLREGESFATGRPAMPANDAGCDSGLCGMSTVGAAPAWQAAGFWDSTANYRASLSGLQDEDDVLGYIVEYMGTGEGASDDCTTKLDLSVSGCSSVVQRYRIVAYSRLENGAEVMLQSYFEVP